MSEKKVYDDGQNQVYTLDTNLTAAQIRAGTNPFRPPTDPSTASIDALRQAVVAQTALLRELSQQVRLGFEDKTLKGSVDGFLQATAVWFEKTWQGQAALAERLDKLASWLEAIQHRQENILGQLRTANQAYSDGVQSKTNQSLTNKTHYQLRKEKARRKAKR